MQVAYLSLPDVDAKQTASLLPTAGFHPLLGSSTHEQVAGYHTGDKELERQCMDLVACKQHKFKIGGLRSSLGASTKCFVVVVSETLYG